MPTQFLYNPARAAQLTTQIDNAALKGIDLRLDGKDAQQAHMRALVRAETMAAKDGLSKTYIADDGQEGVIIGSAADRSRQNPTMPAARLYLAASNAVADSIARVVPDTGNKTIGVEGLGALPVVPLLIALTVVGVAAAVAAVAWAYTEVVRLDKEAASQMQKTNAILELAESGKPIDPNAWSVIDRLAGQTPSTAGGVPWGWLLAGGAGAFLFYSWSTGKFRIFR